MSSCLSGGGRAYGFDLEIVKSPSTFSRTTHSSSSSSTLSESSNSPIAISTRKPRTPRKRPNQTYHEAAALLSTACPNIFSTKNLTKNSKFTKQQQHNYFFDEPTELLLPFRVIDNSGFLLHQPILEKPSFRVESKVVNSYEIKQCQSPVGIGIEIQGDGNSYQDDFDTESMLDEEMEEGIDSIMGNLGVENDSAMINTCYGYPMGMGFSGNFDFGFGFGMRSGVRALRNVDEGNWWSFPSVDITPKLKKNFGEKKKKVEKPAAELMKSLESGQGNSLPGGTPEDNSNPEPCSRLLLKLNYDNVLNAWSDRGSPLPDEISGSESPGVDIHARLAQIDLFSENGGLREASVMRYKEKRRNRLYSKKIRYQVRKVNADRRPRMKGRFVRRPNSPTSGE